MFSLAHISDIHLGPLPTVRKRELVSKRITGYVNWHRNRAQSIGDATLSRVVADIAASQTDHLAITGDMVNLALDSEIEEARRWLEIVGPPQDVTVVPGNHDAYVPGALDKACRAWMPWMNGDGSNTPMDRRSFPFIRRRGPVALIGVSSARATAPFMASGYFRRGQALRLGKALHETGKEGLCRVVMIHHPPVFDAAPSHKRLYGLNLFQRVVGHYGAELIVHGHTHLPSLFCIEGPRGPVPVVGVPAAGQAFGTRKPAGGWNRFEIEGEADDWRIHLERRAVTGETTSLDTLESVQLDKADLPAITLRSRKRAVADQALVSTS